MLAGTPNRMIGRFGTPWTLWRRVQAAGANGWQSGAVTETFYPCLARDRAAAGSAQHRAVKGTIDEAGRIVVLDAKGLAVVPAKGDRLAPGTHVANAPGIRWLQVTDVDAPGYGGANPVYRLQVTE